MTYDEIVQALRCSGSEAGVAAANMIENLTKENTALRYAARSSKRTENVPYLRALVGELRKEIERKDMVIALAQKKQAEAEAEMDALIKLAAQALGTTPERLRDLAAADNEGRVVVMPCKFGDKLYRVFGEEIQEFTVSNIKYMGLQHRWIVDTTPFILYAENLIGTELFLAREEAERAMEGQKHD